MDHLILHVTYRCKEGAAEEFVRAVKESGAQALVRAEDGCLQYDYLISMEERDTVVLLEKWRDSDALASHLRQPHMATIQELKARYTLDSSVERYE